MVDVPIVFTLKGVEKTLAFGERLGRRLEGGDVVGLYGQLGSGKTTLVKGIAKGAGVRDARRVNSPSFVILKAYEGRLPLYHFDVYRLADPRGLDTVGYKDYFYGEGISVVEWADKIEDMMPRERLCVRLTVESEDTRSAQITPYGERYTRLMEKVRL